MARTKRADRPDPKAAPKRTRAQAIAEVAPLVADMIRENRARRAAEAEQSGDDRKAAS